MQHTWSEKQSGNHPSKAASEQNAQSNGKSLPGVSQTKIAQRETAQLINHEEKVPPVQGQFTVQQQKEKEELPTQLRSADLHPFRAASPFQLKEETSTAKVNNTGLPDQLKSGIEQLSGLSADDVKVHYNSDRPAQLQALAYAQGTDIHIAPGQEKHLPHEAWHVVQQKQGRVQPTLQMKESIPVNNDKSLEEEADKMGAQALQRMENKNGLPANKSVPFLQPITQLQLQEGVYFTTKEANLRNNIQHEVIRKLPAREQVTVISKGTRISKFSAGILNNEHSWVRTSRGEEGWIEDSKLQRSPHQPAVQHHTTSSDGNGGNVQAVAQLPAVPRLFPGIVLQEPSEEQRRKWNFGQDEEGESKYNKMKELTKAIDDLQKYQNEHLIPNPQPFVPQEETGGVSSDYHRAGAQAKASAYADAVAAGYNLNDKEVKKLVDKVLSLHHSYYYQSIVTTTGHLI